MSKEWEYTDEWGMELTVYAGSRVEALRRVREKLGRRRLPNGSKLRKCGQNKTQAKWLPPFEIRANRTYMWNTRAVQCLPDLEAAKAAADVEVTYLIRDAAGTLVTSKRTEQEAEAWVAEHGG